MWQESENFVTFFMDFFKFNLLHIALHTAASAILSSPVGDPPQNLHVRMKV